ncbi:MAG TPA: AraC family transcriptional regulator [Pilimelia sp.]|nr:AraC family transcriptional regulator [Pilimelia sp.]
MRAVLLDELRASPHQPLHLPAPRDPRLRALCALLRADPADTRTLAALGSAVGANARTLARLFKADLGMTFPQWRTQLRLHHAVLLLAADAPATAVARTSAAGRPPARSSTCSAAASATRRARTAGDPGGARPDGSYPAVGGVASPGIAGGPSRLPRT